jgi:hypothetical protein
MNDDGRLQALAGFLGEQVAKLDAIGAKTMRRRILESAVAHAIEDVPWAVPPAFIEESSDEELVEVLLSAARCGEMPEVQ